MKKKKMTSLWITTTLLLMAGFIQAQSVYHPITDGCIWLVSDEKYKTAGDTVIDGQTYLKLYRQVGNQPSESFWDNAQYFAAIRNDTAGRKVYAYLPAGMWVRKSDMTFAMFQTEEAQEVLLFDFSLRLGDTVHFYTLGEHIFFECEAVCVESAQIWCGEHDGSLVSHQYAAGDSLVYLSDSSSRRQFFLSNTSMAINLQHVWIEGIGSIYGNDEMALSTTDAGHKILLCFTDSLGGALQTGFDFDEDPDDCYSNGFGGEVSEVEKLFAKIYPNPATEWLHISSQQMEDKDISVRIFNTMGLCVYSETYEELELDKVISVDFLPKGIYTIILEQSKKYYTQKIIKL